MKFTKMNGTGNDFIIIDNFNGEYPDHNWPVLAKKLCQRKFSLGADGLIVLDADPEEDFRMRFFNPDGSEGEMCGNGARCLVRYYHEKYGNNSGKYSFNTLAGVIKSKVNSEGLTSVGMVLDSSIKEMKLEIEARDYDAYHLFVGVPHTVVLMDESWSADQTYIEKIGREIRNSPEFENGTNVNFVTVDEEKNTIYVRTYERGVERETLACGSGSTSSAIVSQTLGLVDFPVKVITRGGKLLVDYIKGRYFLSGPARFVANGHLHPESYNY